MKFFIITFHIRLCANFALPQIGFVFSNSFSQYASRSTQYEINWVRFFKFLLTAEFAENAEETKSPSQLHQREFLHIKNLRALGGKTTELALNWVCFHQVSNRIYFSYLLVIIDFSFIIPIHKLGSFFQNTTYDIPHTKYETRNWVRFFKQPLPEKLRI